MNNKLSDVESKLAVYTAKLEESQNREATITVNMQFFFINNLYCLQVNTSKKFLANYRENFWRQLF